MDMHMGHEGVIWVSNRVSSRVHVELGGVVQGWVCPLSRRACLKYNLAAPLPTATMNTALQTS